MLHETIHTERISMKQRIFVTLLSGTIAASAQDTTQVSISPWNHTLVAALTVTQVALSDWQQGGENALSYTMGIKGKSEHDAPASRWTTSYALAFGQAKLGARSLRKTDDKIELESVFRHKLGGYVDPYIAATLKTQFARGYTYDKVTDAATPVSDFFDPAYLTQSAGAGVQLSPEVKTRLGLALREILTSSFTQYSDDPATSEVERTRVDGGLESVTNVDWKIEENILLTWQLEFFTPLKKLAEFSLRSTSTLTAGVNKFSNVNLINDKRVTPRTQVRETLGISISYTVF
jgi:hypothetical protein